MQFPCAFDPCDSDTWDNVDNDEHYYYSYDEESIPENIEDLNAHPEPEVETAENDDQIHFSPSINKSKEFIKSKFGIPVCRLSKEPIQGLVIMPLECFCQIRNKTTLHTKETPHILVIPTNEQFAKIHEDFSNALGVFYPDQ